jgi:hypothetical protein
MWPALLFLAGFALVLTAVEPIIDGVAGSSILFFVSTTDEHDGDLWDSDYMLRDAISFAMSRPIRRDSIAPLKKLRVFLTYHFRYKNELDPI